MTGDFQAAIFNTDMNTATRKSYRKHFHGNTDVTLKVLVTIIDALGHFKQDNYSIVGGDRGSRVGEVRAGTTSPMPDHKGLSYSNCQEIPHYF